MSVAKVTGGSDAGAFRVEVVDVDTACTGDACKQDGAFTILLP